MAVAAAAGDGEGGFVNKKTTTPGGSSPILAFLFMFVQLEVKATMVRDFPSDWNLCTE